MSAVLSAVPLWLLPAWLALMSLALFFLMGIDKHRARRGRWRIPEKTLFLLALLGGSCGGWLGMRAFHHKTRHRTFAWGFPVLALAQLALCLYLTYRFFEVRGS